MSYTQIYCDICKQLIPLKQYQQHTDKHHGKTAKSKQKVPTNPKLITKPIQTQPFEFERQYIMCSICSQRIPSTLYSDHTNEHAKAKELGQMQIFGKTITGKIIILDVEKSDTILELKKKIETKIGVSYDQIRLQYKGKSLGDDLNQIQVYNIQNNETIYVILRISVEDQLKL